MIRRMIKKSIKKALGIDAPSTSYRPSTGSAPSSYTAPTAPTPAASAPAPAPAAPAPEKAVAKEAAPKKAAAKKAAPKKASAKKAAPKKASAKKAAAKKPAAKKVAAKKAAPKKAAAKKPAAKKAAAKKAAAKKAAPKKADPAPTPAPEVVSTDDTAGAALRMDTVQEILDEMVRPALQGDGGDINLIKIEDNDIYVRLVGACNTCPSSIMTMKMGVEALLKEEFPSMRELIQVDSALPA